MTRRSMELLDSDAFDLVQSLWLRSTPHIQKLFNGDRQDKLNHEAYCDYYRRQWYILAPHAGHQHSTVRSSHAIVYIIQDILNGKHQEEIMNALMSTNTPKEVCDLSLNLAVRLLVMMRFGMVKNQVSPRRCLQWESGSLQDFVQQYFKEPPKLNCERVRLPKSFDAWAIATISGVEISFTDNLADHLLLVEDDTKLLVFHHASFLEYHRVQSSVFPDGLVDETLRTLALLFPQAQFSNHQRARGPRRKWLQSLRARYLEKEETIIDSRLALCGTPHGDERQIERFHFWRDRLVVLKQTYDDATPKTLGQWWHDRRNGVQWYTFWVAILVLIVTTFLSVVQAVEGALQVYKSFEASK